MAKQGRWMSTAELRSLFKDGLTYDEIAEVNYQKWGWRPSRSTVALKREALGLPPRRPSNRDTIPWAVLPQHNSHLFRHMLGAEARARRGAALSGSDTRLLTRMHDLLYGRGTLMTIDYDPKTSDGFMLVLRDPDDDIFRAPRTVGALRLDLQTELRSAGSDGALVDIAFRNHIRPEVLEDMGRQEAAEALRERMSAQVPAATGEALTDGERASVEAFVEAVQANVAHPHEHERGA